MLMSSTFVKTMSTFPILRRQIMVILLHRRLLMTLTVLLFLLLFITVINPSVIVTVLQSPLIAQQIAMGLQKLFLF